MDKIKPLIIRNKILILVLIIAAVLRLWRLESIPPSLYIDELDLGYQAFSLLHTGRDYFGNLLPLHPHSFAEYRTPFNIYTSIPTVWLFGINAYGIRLPSAFFGILSVVSLYLLIREMFTYNDLAKSNLGKYKIIAVLGALILALSPWHIQFSRVTLEVSALFFFLTLGLFLFFKSFTTPKVLWLSALTLCLTPWIYSTAKLFIPALIIFIFFVWHKEILKYPKKDLIKSVLVLIILGLPMIYMTLSGKAGSRFNYISVFSDPTVRTEVNYAREFDATVRGENQIGAQPNFIDKFFHNKLLFWTDNMIANYTKSISSDFLFFNGDLNLRHSPRGIGQFYWFEIIPLLIGLVLFFGKFNDRKIKYLIIFWIVFGIFPSAVTRDGGSHAPRLIIILSPLIFLISFGIVKGAELFKNNLKKIIITAYSGLWFLSVAFYFHTYLVHYPWDSERWWNAGYKEMIDGAKEIENDFDKIIITTADEPPLIFFAAYYPYDPVKWQEAIKNTSLLGEVGVKKIGKYVFDQYRVNSLSENIDESTVYISSAREVEYNLLMEPVRIPSDLNLIKSIALPSGEPAFYFFTKKESI